MRGPRFYLALWLSKLAARVIDVIAKGRGTNLPGAIALRIDPNFLGHIGGIDRSKTIFVTGTNGKSTTTKLLNRVLTGAGYRVISNLSGANMTAGVAVPLLKSCSLTGNVQCDYVVMETDERYVAQIRKQIPAKYLAITNIQKDQVQRNGEPSFIREKIRQAIHPDMRVFLNGDDPNSMSLCNAGAECILRYGVAPHARSFQKTDDFFAVTTPCPVCHSGIVFQQYNLDNIGPFHCPNCGFGSGENHRYLTSEVSFADKWFKLNGITFPFNYNLPQLLYSYTLVTAIALDLGVEEAAIREAMSDSKKHNGQGEYHKIGAHGANFFRIKQENSETLQSAVNVISADRKAKTVIFGLDEYIDFHPPYINGCYMFDCDFRALRKTGKTRCISTSPALGRCGALRLLYDGFAPDSVKVLPDSREQTMEAALEGEEAGRVYLIEEIPFWKQ